MPHEASARIEAVIILHEGVSQYLKFHSVNLPRLVDPNERISFFTRRHIEALQIEKKIKTAQTALLTSGFNAPDSWLALPNMPDIARKKPLGLGFSVVYFDIPLPAEDFRYWTQVKREIEAVVVRLRAGKPEPGDSGQHATQTNAERSGKSTGKRGAPTGNKRGPKPDSPDDDAEIARKWEDYKRKNPTGKRPTHAAFADSLEMPIDEVRAALERHRKQLANSAEN